MVSITVQHLLDVTKQVTTVLTFTIRQMSELETNIVSVDRQMSELETNIVSVERLKEFTEIPNEAEWYRPEKKPPSNWPQDGHVQFHDYMTRYRPGLDFVLRGVNFQIKPRETVGIVGRTGAGNSSLTVALFRLSEASAGPCLVLGSMNLDPFDIYTDEQVRQAREHAHMKRFVNALSSGLLHECGEGSQNLRIMVLDNGCIVEYDVPAMLMKNKHGLFYGMAKDAGLV